MKQVVWITGASSGIGAALVRQYCNSGHYVIATARSKQRLEKVISSCSSPENVTISIADLENLDELQQLVTNLWGIHQGIDTVILNAGVGQWGSVQDTKIEVENKIFNLVSLLQFLRTTCAVVTFWSTANKLETVRHYTLQPGATVHHYCSSLYKRTCCFGFAIVLF